MKFRASQLGKLMTSSRTKGEALSQTAKSYIIEKAKQDFYGYRSELTNKYVLKGIEQEQDSIDLLNLYVWRTMLRTALLQRMSG